MPTGSTRSRVKRRRNALKARSIGSRPACSLTILANAQNSTDCTPMLVIAAVGRQRRRHLGDRQAAERRLDDHLQRKLHPRGSQPERQDRVAPEAAEAAVEVAERDPEQAAAEKTEHRIA